jgi:hypothetical protein
MEFFFRDKALASSLNQFFSKLRMKSPRKIDSRGPLRELGTWVAHNEYGLDKQGASRKGL